MIILNEKQNVLKKYMKRFLFLIIFSVAMAVGHNYLNLQLPLMLRTLVDDVILKGQWELIDEMALILVAIFVGAGVFSLFRTLAVSYIGQNVVFEIRADMYRALQKQSFSVF